MIRRTTWIVLGIFLAVLAAAIIIERRQPATEQAGVTPAATQANLLPVTSAEISGLRLEETATGEVVELRLDESGAWQLLQPQPEPADPALVESRLSSLTSLRVQTSLEPAASLGIFGLTNPAYRLALQTSSGQELTLLVGDQTPTSNGYYVQVNDGTPQVVNKFSLDSFLTMLVELPVPGDESPGQGDESPGQGDESPGQGDESLGQGDESLGQEAQATEAAGTPTPEGED